MRRLIAFEFEVKTQIRHTERKTGGRSEENRCDNTLSWGEHGVLIR